MVDLRDQRPRSIFQCAAAIYPSGCEHVCSWDALYFHLFTTSKTTLIYCSELHSMLFYLTKEQLLATDVLVLATMKNAAKCDT